MNLNLLFAMAFGFIIILTLLSRLGSSTSSRHYQYRKHKALFTPAERSFLGVLDNAVGEQYRILGKVRIADVITPEKGMTRQHWQNAFNKISAKHFDYLLCDKQTLDVIAAIELDDKSHKQAKTIARDQLVEDACRTAGLPLIRFDAKRGYHVESVRTTIASTLEPDFEPEIETIPQIIASRD
ncbi:DUF2726 domain-containing protein [Shewanella loihica]|nr:DUF2726 domain-containing protein [Shewanella loihica]